MEHKTVQFKQQEITGRIFKGYAATYDLDQGGDVILPGAFSKTISERRDDVKILWQHDQPIGKPQVLEPDEKGLYVEGKISKFTLGDDALELMKDGVIDQMSIGYSVPQGKAEYKDGIRYIKELKLYEISLVTFPMNEAARITGLKSKIDYAIKSGDLDQETIEHLIAQLKALQTTEPSKDTQPGKEPLELSGIKSLIENFGR